MSAVIEERSATTPGRKVFEHPPNLVWNDCGDEDPLQDLDLDVTIRVAKKEYQGPSRVLCEYSSYIRDHFARIITLPLGISCETFILVCSWMLLVNKKRHNLFRSYNVVHVLEAAQVLGIPELARQCRWFINNPRITSEHQAYLVYKDAKNLRYLDIMETVVPRINAYFLFLVGMDDYLELEVDDIVSLLSSSAIRCHSEVEVFMAAAYWLLHDWSTRKVHALNVMRCVRFSLIAPLHLIDIKYPKNVEFIPFSEIPELKNMLRDALWVSTILHGQGGGDNELNMTNHIRIYRNVIPGQRNWFSEEKMYAGNLYDEFLVTIATCNRVAIEQRDFDDALERRTHYFEDE